jgi:hypothetical protein
LYLAAYEHFRPSTLPRGTILKRHCPPPPPPEPPSATPSSQVVKVTDECEMLVRVLGEEIGKFSRQLEARKGAA